MSGVLLKDGSWVGLDVRYVSRPQKDHINMSILHPHSGSKAQDMICRLLVFYVVVWARILSLWLQACSNA